MKKLSNWQYTIEKEDVKSFCKNQPIWKNGEERREYIKQEINSESINNNAISKARVRYLSKMI